MPLDSVDIDEYNSTYKEHLFQQYKLYLHSIEKNSDRRHSCNSFFLAIHTAVLGAIGFYNSYSLGGTRSTLCYIMPLVGFTLCLVWVRLIRSYRDLSSHKFRVLSEIEGMLPISPFHYEWELIRRPKKRPYVPFSGNEKAIPYVFMILYTGVAAFTAIGI